MSSRAKIGGEAAPNPSITIQGPGGYITIAANPAGGATFYIHDADGGGFFLDAGRAVAAYVAGWLAMTAGIDLVGLREASRDRDDVRDRWGAH